MEIRALQGMPGNGAGNGTGNGIGEGAGRITGGITGGSRAKRILCLCLHGSPSIDSIDPVPPGGEGRKLRFGMSGAIGDVVHRTAEIVNGEDRLAS